MTEAIRARLDRVNYAHTGFFTSEPAGPLADLLIAHAPEGIARICPVSGGVKAMEAALTLARHDMLESGQPGRPPGGSRGARAITATGWGRWRPAATGDGAAPSRHS